MNRIDLIGRLTRDPEFKIAANHETAICNFTLAVNRAFKRDETDFINVVAFGKTAKTISQYFTKGGLIAITGALRIENYEKDGVNKTMSKVVVDSFYFLGDNGKSEPVNNSSDEFDTTGMESVEGDYPF